MFSKPNRKHFTLAARQAAGFVLAAQIPYERP
jgi:hypothetical protein